MIPKVFISYAWENEEFSKKILMFSNKLRKNGIDANIDQYEENPDMGWLIWMEKQIEDSDYVLVVSTKTYFQKFQQIKEGKGVSWEVNSIYQSLYNLKGHNDKFIPVVFDENDKQFILKALQPYTNYNIESQFQKLINRMKGISNTIKPPVLEPLPKKIRKTMFLASPINIELWDRAKWRGVVFLFSPNSESALGLLYEGDSQAALKIFEEWQKYETIDNYIDFCFIEGTIEGLPSNGYTLLISPNISKVVESASFINESEEIFIMAITRFQRMYPSDNFSQFKKLKEVRKHNPKCPVCIMPITLKDSRRGFTSDNMTIHPDKKIYTKNIRYMDASEIKETDLESCIMPKYNRNFPS